MSKESDKKPKVAPPRESDAARQNRLMTQLGLNAGPHCAKQRRHLARLGKTHKQRRR